MLAQRRQTALVSLSAAHGADVKRTHAQRLNEQFGLPVVVVEQHDDGGVMVARQMD